MSDPSRKIYLKAKALAERWFSEGGLTHLVTFLAAAHLVASRTLETADAEGIDKEKLVDRLRDVLGHADGNATAYIAASACVSTMPAGGSIDAVRAMGFGYALAGRDPERAFALLSAAAELAANNACLSVHQRALLLEHLPALVQSAQARIDLARGDEPRYVFLSRGGDA